MRSRVSTCDSRSGYHIFLSQTRSRVSTCASRSGFHSSLQDLGDYGLLVPISRSMKIMASWFRFPAFIGESDVESNGFRVIRVHRRRDSVRGSSNGSENYITHKSRSRSTGIPNPDLAIPNPDLGLGFLCSLSRSKRFRSKEIQIQEIQIYRVCVRFRYGWFEDYGVLKIVRFRYGWFEDSGDIPAAATAEDIDIVVKAVRRALKRDEGKEWASASGAHCAKYLRVIAAKVTEKKDKFAKLEAIDCILDTNPSCFFICNSKGGSFLSSLGQEMNKFNALEVGIELLQRFGCIFA